MRNEAVAPLQGEIVHLVRMREHEEHSGKEESEDNEAGHATSPLAAALEARAPYESPRGRHASQSQELPTHTARRRTFPAQ